MGRGKRNEQAKISPRPAEASAHPKLPLYVEDVLEQMVSEQLDALASRRDGRYHPPLPSYDETFERISLELAYSADRIGKAGIEHAVELTKHRFLEAGINLIDAELVDNRYHAEDTAYVQVSVAYDDLTRAWEFAHSLRDEFDREEVSGVSVGCGDLSGEEYLARVAVDRAALAESQSA